MDDLQRRFASLDRLPVPDLWVEIQDRSTDGAATAPQIPTLRVDTPVWRAPRARGQTLLVAAVVAVLGVGTIAVGSGVVRMPTIDPPPSPTPFVATPAPSVTAPPSPTAVSSAGLVAYNVAEPIDPAPEGCTPPNGPWCRHERIWTANSDGSAARPLLPSVPGNQRFLAWHPDGSRLLYRDERGALVLSDLSGSTAEVFPLTETCPVSNCPYLEGVALSPTGTRVVYVLDDSAEGNTSVLAIFDMETREIALLEATRARNDGSCASVNEGLNDSPVWSPDGTTIAFARQGVGPRQADGGCLSRLFLIDADGRNLRDLVPPELRPLYPRWAPDGSMIAFHDSALTDPTIPEIDIHVVRPDGTGLRQLSDDGDSGWPRWSSDGRIIFVRWTTADRDRYEVWRMDQDGTGAARLDPSISALSAAGCMVCPDAREPTSGAELHWQPVP